MSKAWSKLDSEYFGKFVAAFTDDWAGHLPRCGYSEETPDCGCSDIGRRLIDTMREYAEAVRGEAYRDST